MGVYNDWYFLLLYFGGEFFIAWRRFYSVIDIDLAVVVAFSQKKL
jgi:hypothetical protein